MAEAPARRTGGKGSTSDARPDRQATRASRTTSRAATTTRTRKRATAAAPDAVAADERARLSWLELVTAVVQAPVGLGRAQADRLVGELVKTGNLGQREAERLLRELRLASGRAQGRAQSASAGLDRFIESRIEDVLNRVNIPSRSDIERLNRSVDVLTTKVDALLGRRERTSH